MSYLSKKSWPIQFIRYNSFHSLQKLFRPERSGVEEPAVVLPQPLNEFSSKQQSPTPRESVPTFKPKAEWKRDVSLVVAADSEPRTKTSPGSLLSVAHSGAQHLPVHASWVHLRAERRGSSAPR